MLKQLRVLFDKETATLVDKPHFNIWWHKKYCGFGIGLAPYVFELTILHFTIEIIL